MLLDLLHVLRHADQITNLFVSNLGRFCIPFLYEGLNFRIGALLFSDLGFRTHGWTKWPNPFFRPVAVAFARSKHVAFWH